MDESVGGLLGLLNETGLDRDTVVIFMSDEGVARITYRRTSG